MEKDDGWTGWQSVGLQNQLGGFDSHIRLQFNARCDLVRTLTRIEPKLSMVAGSIPVEGTDFI